MEGNVLRDIVDGAILVMGWIPYPIVCLLAYTFVGIIFFIAKQKAHRKKIDLVDEYYGFVMEKKMVPTLHKVKRCINGVTRLVCNLGWIVFLPVYLIFGFLWRMHVWRDELNYLDDPYKELKVLDHILECQNSLIRRNGWTLRNDEELLNYSFGKRIRLVKRAIKYKPNEWYSK